jgi:hypothetical protein
MNKKFFMSNDSLFLVEDVSFFSPISQLNYEFYTDEEKLVAFLRGRPELQCIAGIKFTPFGRTQYPQLKDYADDIDTVSFLTEL